MTDRRTDGPTEKWLIESLSTRLKSAGISTGIDELNVPGNGVFADAGLEPWLTQFVASHVNRHPGFEIVHATEDEIQRSVRQAARADALDEVIVILDGGDVVVERLDCHVRINSLK